MRHLLAVLVILAMYVALLVISTGCAATPRPSLPVVQLAPAPLVLIFNPSLEHQRPFWTSQCKPGDVLLVCRFEPWEGEACAVTDNGTHVPYEWLAIALQRQWPLRSWNIRGIPFNQGLNCAASSI